MDEAQLEEKRQQAAAVLERLKNAEINKDVVIKLCEAFAQNVGGLSNFEVFKDVEGFAFAHTILKHMTDPEGALQMIIMHGPPDKKDAQRASAFFVGIIVGIYLTEIGRTALILRE